jgi:glycosyltransferase involved in cell wall biosynthesis
MLEALLELFPSADIYTHVHDAAAVSPLINSHKITTSFIQRLPFAKKLYPIYMPLMPRALIDFNLQKYDLIISSEAGPAKGVVPNPDAFHICYCHSPMRYLWDLYHEYFRGANFFVRFFMKALIPSLRVWDITSANMVDKFITNSNYVAKRIKRYYNRDAEVVFGPADVESFNSDNNDYSERNIKDYYLFFGQVAFNKNVDVALEACVRTGRKLVVSGGGAKKKLIRHYEKTGLVTFTGRVLDNEKKRLFSEAKALLFPGIEDMGLVPIEANAAGCPVIAFRKGGVLDTVKENVTGIFFDEQTAESLAGALDEFESGRCKLGSRAEFTAQAARFSKAAFKERILRVVEATTCAR